MKKLFNVLVLLSMIFAISCVEIGSSNQEADSLAVDSLKTDSLKIDSAIIGTKVNLDTLVIDTIPVKK